MNIDRNRYIDINKYTLILVIIYYLISVFLLKTLPFGLILIFTVCLINLFCNRYYQGRLKLAALNFLLPAGVAVFTAGALLEKVSHGTETIHLVLVLLLSLLPSAMLYTGQTTVKPSTKKTIPLVKIRIAVQVLVFTVYVTLSACTWILGSKSELYFWAVVNILTVSILPFLFGRAICGWICPNSTLQDALYKNLKFKRPISQLPEAIESQSRTSAMYLSGVVDKNAPYLPFTLLLCWFPIFFLETVFDLTQAIWYPTCFVYGLCILSLLFPWRKFCTHFCWLSSYRCLAGQNSLWRLRFNKANCRQCKVCAAEAACPMHIDISCLTQEMPATCCLCFSCMDACPAKDVISLRRKESYESIVSRCDR
ncbi:MAG: 4Fe-4S binding protein [Desulfotomaculaceae bacterium]|nr:4Fe-4S binding protein [Desulfotomaculaceae bacterium]